MMRPGFPASITIQSVELSFDELAREILARPCLHRVRLIAIDGGAGAGKTTFAARLAAALGAPIIQLDDFISWDDLEHFWPRLEAEVLEPLFRGEDLHFQIRDWVGDVRGRGLLAERTHMPFAPTVVLEGVTSSRKALTSRLSFSVWLEAPAPLRMARGLERDADVPDNREMWEGWLPMETAFLHADGARSRADLIVDGTRPAADGRFHVLERRQATPPRT
jgi:uridine kinase